MGGPVGSVLSTHPRLQLVVVTRIRHQSPRAHMGTHPARSSPLYIAKISNHTWVVLGSFESWL